MSEKRLVTEIRRLVWLLPATIILEISELEENLPNISPLEAESFSAIADFDPASLTNSG
jgi:hypothetical protein